MMTSRMCFPKIAVAALCFIVAGVVATPAQAQTFTVLYNFTQFDGTTPTAGVTQDPAGNLYGTTVYGGDLGEGVVFQVTTSGTETVLHSFCSQTKCVDGANPYTPLVRDKSGNLYGTTYNGGSSYYGAVFKIDSAGNEAVLYSFSGSDGCDPLQGVVIDKSGNLYGTTANCGWGTIFKVDSAGHETVLHSFAVGSSDGAYPSYGHLTMDKSGNLYGATKQGGASNGGVLYELKRKGAYSVLHSFGGTSDGFFPYGTVVRDKRGSLYGTTEFGGSYNYGTIWKVTKKGKETILHNFAGGASDGCYPFAGVARDSKGNLYGVTTECGANNYGALYELSANGTLTLLHSFGSGADGANPYGEVLGIAKGTLYGTTTLGGTNNGGTVWSYVP